MIEKIIEIKPGTTFNEVVAAIRVHTNNEDELKKIFKELVDIWLSSKYIITKNGMQID